VLNKVDLVTDETRKAARAWLGELVPDTHIIESRRGNVPLPLLLGDVKKIGLRTTHIQTADNRMVIIPNSIIGKNQVINHTYSDQNSRSETYVRVAYGTDIKAARQIITATVRRVEGVLPDKPVDVLCHEMGESGMILRAWWWIGYYRDLAFVRDRVIDAIQAALDENGLAIAYPIRELDLRVTPETVTKLSRAFRDIRSDLRADPHVGNGHRHHFEAVT
jgi:small-conductance mechanosensitive channel